MSYLQDHYRKKVISELMKERKYSSIMEVPKIEKITLNMGVGEAVANKKIIDHAVDDLTKISGQKPVVTLTKKSEANFKTRQGWPIGCKVTLRGKNMYDFLYRLLAVVLPKVRDFRGLNRKSFDGRGNFSFGIREQIAFESINYDTIDAIRGLDVCVTTSAKSDEDGLSLLVKMMFPIKGVRNGK
ncbi:MAG TPA: 50S ribosomal protein L5 [Gammaproteobacteria bacterium]|nr:50S ribosomal protein L5 [Gammaproteobacteria bacterium]